jgi:hypothetical protein
MTKRLKITGFALVVFVAASVLVAASAQAQAPEFGRCKKVAGEIVGRKTVYHGAYGNPTCTTASPEAKGRYEWFPGVVKAHFTAVSKPGTKVLFRLVDGKKISCTGETENGEYTTPKLEQNVVFTFTGCNFEERSGVEHLTYQASSEGAKEGEIVTEPTECELGVVGTGATPATDKLGLSCAEEGEFMWLKWKVRGYIAYEYELCFRGWWFLTTKANSMSASPTTLQSTQSKGVQKIERFVEGPPEPLEATLNRGPEPLKATRNGGGSFEKAGLSLTSVQTNEEAVEANSVA